MGSLKYDSRVSVIHDKRGREYHVAQCNPSADFTRFNIEDRGRRIGFANCTLMGDDVLHLDDLHIEVKAMRPPWFPVDLFFWIGSFPPERWRITNYRKRGIGTAMIKFLVGFARSKSAKRIEGEVKAKDFKDNPDLLGWYRRRGFEVVMGDEKAAAVAKISLAI